MTNFIYADNAATTKLSDAAFRAMLPYLKEQYGNPSSIYAFGGQAKKAVEDAREQIAEAIGADPKEIFFTSGGTEADNWAIKGAAYAQAKKGKRHIISSAFEHHAVLHCLNSLEKDGFEITLLPVYGDGLVRAVDLRAAIRPDTALVTLMYANNEIGTVQPIAQLGQICRDAGVPFHTDAVQAVGNVEIDVKAQNISLLSLSGHKLHGPKGVGALYCKKGLRLRQFMDGGAQESGRRAGTENVAGIAGLGAAVEAASKDIAARAKKVSVLRDRLIGSLLKIERSHINGDAVSRLPGNINMCFEGVEGESLILLLDMKGICASSGSACTSGSLDPSHVLLAIGLPHEIAHGSLRLSLCEENTAEEIEYIERELPPIINRLRAMSPLWEKIQNSQSVRAADTAIINS